MSGRLKRNKSTHFGADGCCWQRLGINSFSPRLQFLFAPHIWCSTKKYFGILSFYLWLLYLQLGSTCLESIRFA